LQTFENIPIGRTAKVAARITVATEEEGEEVNTKEAQV